MTLLLPQPQLADAASPAFPYFLTSASSPSPPPFATCPVMIGWGPAQLSPLSSIKGIRFEVGTCAALGLAVDLQTRQVIPTTPHQILPPPIPQHLTVPQLSAQPVQGFYFYFMTSKWKLAFLPFLNCPLSVDLGRLSISITLTAVLSSPGKVFTRQRSPFRVI